MEQLHGVAVRIGACMYHPIQAAIKGTIGVLITVLAVVQHLSGDDKGALVLMGCALVMFILATVSTERK